MSLSWLFSSLTSLWVSAKQITPITDDTAMYQFISEGLRGRAGLVLNAWLFSILYVLMILFCRPINGSVILSFCHLVQANANRRMHIIVLNTIEISPEYSGKHHRLPNIVNVSSFRIVSLSKSDNACCQFLYMHKIDSMNVVLPTVAFVHALCCSPVSRL